VLQSEFDEFIKYNNSKLKGISSSEKIKIFVDWCIKYNTEELILRLSTDGSLRQDASYFIDFMTRGLLIRTKTCPRQLDSGFVAGIAPLPYRLLDDKLKINDISKRTLAQMSNLMAGINDGTTRYISYSQVQQIILEHIHETKMVNEVGSVLFQNYLMIKATDHDNTYFLSASAHELYGEIDFLLSIVLPEDVLKIHVGPVDVD
jgi:hypothetical protein